MCYIHTYEDSIMKPTKTAWKKGEEWEGEWTYNERGKLVPGTMYTGIELSQWNPLVLLMYDK
jgi:hypothetical protein